jgi:hypothetical protein
VAQRSAKASRAAAFADINCRPPARMSRRERTDREASMPDKHAGTCFCGAVAIEATGEPVDMGYCHCSDCRSYSGGPVNAFTLWRAEDVQVVRGAEHLAQFNKSSFSDRRFCAKCGGHVMVGHPSLGLIDIHASTLPTLAFAPTAHLNYAQTVLPMKDGLPKLKDFPKEIGGSGELLAE